MATKACCKFQDFQVAARRERSIRPQESGAYDSDDPLMVTSDEGGDITLTPLRPLKRRLSPIPDWLKQVKPLEFVLDSIVEECTFTHRHAIR